MLDEKGEAVSHKFFSDETGRIGLVHPEELTETERKFWKKQLTFDGIWRGPEYGPEIITMDKADESGRF